MHKYGVKRARVYGSYARGEEQKDSDIDILVALGDMPLSVWDFVRMRSELAERLNVPVDLVTEDSVLEYLKPYIERDATVVYEER